MPACPTSPPIWAICLTNEEAIIGLLDVGESVRREVERHLQEYIIYRLESRPRSLKFLERLRAEGAPVAGP